MGGRELRHSDGQHSVDGEIGAADDTDLGRSAPERAQRLRVARHDERARALAEQERLAVGPQRPEIHVGAEPLGLTNCLNFGNPEKPHVAWQLSRAVAGLADACRAFSIPVVGGNVSLYNEAGAGPIFPTPVVGLVGELPKASRSGRLGFAEEGDVVAVISAGSWAPAAMGSELAKLRGEAPFGELPQADLGELRALHAAVRQAVRAGALRSVHDVAEGGLAVALAEACLAGGLGATVDLSPLRPAGEALLFGEGPGAFVVSGPEQSLRAFGSAATRIGTVTGSDLVITGELSVPVAELSATHAGGLADLL